MGAAEYVIKTEFLVILCLVMKPTKAQEEKKKKKEKQNIMWQFCIFFFCLLISFYRRLFICLKSA